MLEREIKERFYEVPIIYTPRIKYFFTEYFSFFVVSVLILFLSDILISILGWTLGILFWVEIFFRFYGLFSNTLLTVFSIFIFSLYFLLDVNSLFSIFYFFTLFLSKLGENGRKCFPY
jgi:hypothetical protein